MKWTEEETTLVQLFNEQGMSDLQIAKEIDRPVSSVGGLRSSLGLVNKTTKNMYNHLYKGTVGEVQARLIKIMQEAPFVSYEYFNSKNSGVPPATAYRKFFGSWSNALNAAGVVTSSKPGSTYSQKVEVPCKVYLLDFGDFYKIGITQQTLSQRFGGRYPPYTVILTLEMSLAEAKALEKQWLNTVKPYQFIPDCFPAEGRGFTECFKY